MRSPAIQPCFWPVRAGRKPSPTKRFDGSDSNGVDSITVIEVAAPFKQPEPLAMERRTRHGPQWDYFMPGAASTLPSPGLGEKICSFGAQSNRLMPHILLQPDALRCRCVKTMAAAASQEHVTG